MRSGSPLPLNVTDQPLVCLTNGAFLLNLTRMYAPPPKLPPQAQLRNPATTLNPRCPTSADLANGPDENASERDVHCRDPSAVLKLVDQLKGTDASPLRLKIDGNQPFCFAVSDTDVQPDMSLVELLEQAYRQATGFACDVGGEPGRPDSYAVWIEQYAPARCSKSPPQ